MTVIGIDALQVEGQQSIEQATATGTDGVLQAPGQAEHGSADASEQGPSDRLQPQSGADVSVIGLCR